MTDEIFLSLMLRLIIIVVIFEEYIRPRYFPKTMVKRFLDG